MKKIQTVLSIIITIIAIASSLGLKVERENKKNIEQEKIAYQILMTTFIKECVK